MHSPLLTGLQGDRLYIGTAAGNIHIYNLNEGTDAGLFVFSRHCILTDVPLCGLISRRSKPNSHVDRDQDWDIQEGHRSVRVHQGFKLVVLSGSSVSYPSASPVHRCPLPSRNPSNVVPTPFFFTTHKTHSSKERFVVRRPF